MEYVHKVAAVVLFFGLSLLVATWIFADKLIRFLLNK